jgi:hypothetical protein
MAQHTFDGERLATTVMVRCGQSPWASATISPKPRAAPGQLAKMPLEGSIIPVVEDMFRRGQAFVKFNDKQLEAAMRSTQCSTC